MSAPPPSALDVDDLIKKIKSTIQAEDQAAPPLALNIDELVRRIEEAIL